MTRVVRPPAKVNLSLLVGPPGPDAYHPLSTVFVPVDLRDEIELDVAVSPADRVPPRPVGRPEVEVLCAGIDPASNLVTRAVSAVEIITGWVVSGRISVRKGIPVGAGLGGGSSDAASVLRVVGELVEVGGGPRIEGPDLVAAARFLGADVPFFLGPGPALAAGVGDVLEPLHVPSLPLVLVLPDRELSTAEVYRTFDSAAAAESAEAFRDRRLLNETAWRVLARAVAEGPPGPGPAARAIAPLLENDLERASFRLMPGLAHLKGLLMDLGALGALMSGSGPTMFGLFETRDDAVSAQLAVERAGHRALAVLTLA